MIGLLPLARVGLAITDYLAKRFGARRASGVCAGEAARLLGLRGVPGGSQGRRLAWERWGPLVMTLPGVVQWSAADKKALTEIIDAKGGRRERDFVLRLDSHRPLRKAIRQLAAEHSDGTSEPSRQAQ